MNDSLDASYFSLTEVHPDLVNTLKYIASRS